MVRRDTRLVRTRLASSPRPGLADGLRPRQSGRADGARVVRPQVSAGELPVETLRPGVVRGQHLGDCLRRHRQVDPDWWNVMVVSLTLRTAHDPRVLRALSHHWVVSLHQSHPPRLVGRLRGQMVSVPRPAAKRIGVRPKGRRDPSTSGIVSRAASMGNGCVESGCTSQLGRTGGEATAPGRFSMRAPGGCFAAQFTGRANHRARESQGARITGRANHRARERRVRDAVGSEQSPPAIGGDSPIATVPPERVYGVTRSLSRRSHSFVARRALCDHCCPVASRPQETEVRCLMPTGPG